MQNIIIGVTGSIAAYKIPGLVKQLLRHHFSVQVVLTHNAQQFVTPSAFHGLQLKGLYTGWTNDLTESTVPHITLAKWADLIVIVPASANFIAKLAHGLANDFLSTLCLASVAPIFVFPAMNTNMWQNPATQSNVMLLGNRSITVFEPEYGLQACGSTGLGRMQNIEKVLHHIIGANPKPFLNGLRILITAGATHEPIDPVRFITNRSSGKMGYALATQASILGACVTLISSNSHLPIPPTCKEFIAVATTPDLYKAVTDKIAHQDIFISCAAVSDYRVTNYSPQKIKRTSNQQLILVCEPYADILAHIAKHYPVFTVGFAAETSQIIKHAKAKLMAKGVDLMIANDVTQPTTGFESDDNEVQVISRTQQIKLNKAPKMKIAQDILRLIHQAFLQQQSPSSNQ